MIQRAQEGKNNVETRELCIYIPKCGNSCQKTFFNFLLRTGGTVPLKRANCSYLHNSHGMWTVLGFCLVRPLAELWQLYLWAGSLLTCLLLYP